MKNSSVGHIFDIKRFAVHDGPGIRTTIFLKGCPLSCIWCHNPEGINPDKEIGFIQKKCIGCSSCITACPNGVYGFSKNSNRIYKKEKCTMCLTCIDSCYSDALALYGKDISVDCAADIILEDEMFYKSSNGGVTLSGGEPLMQAEFSTKLLKRCTELKIHTALDTSGFAPWKTFENLIPYVNLILYDFKHIIDEQHIKYTGVSNKLIIENLIKLSSLEVPIEIRIPVIPGINDDAEYIKLTGELFENIKIKTVKLLPYHQLAGSKYAAIGRKNTLPENSCNVSNSIKIYADLLKEFDIYVIT